MATTLALLPVLALVAAPALQGAGPGSRAAAASLLRQDQLDAGGQSASGLDARQRQHQRVLEQRLVRQPPGAEPGALARQRQSFAREREAARLADKLVRPPAASTLVPPPAPPRLHYLR